MPLYSYEAMDNLGNMIEGKIEAEDQWTVATRLSKMGYTTLAVEEIKESTNKITFGKRKVKIGELAFFSRQLAAMLLAGIPLTRCLYTLSEQTSNQMLAACAGDIATKVESGTGFSEAMGSHKNIFSPMYIEMVKAGELSGSLNEILTRLSIQLEKDKLLKDSLKAATFYPSVVLTFAALVIIAMMFFVVPIFMGMFPPGMELPLPTKIVVGFSNSLRNYWYLHVIGFVLTILGLKIYLNSELGRKTWDEIKFRLPIFGELFKKATIARFCRMLATLLGGGIPVLQALESAGPSSGSRQVTEAIRLTGTRIQEGQSIATPLRESKFFPPMVINMIAVGEETGQLSALLGRVADFYEEEVATMTKGLSSILEPLLLIIVGITIGAIVIAIYLPIFTVVTSVGQ
ncbi:type II secretion system F family protein [Desulfotomaculum defluvii]